MAVTVSELFRDFEQDFERLRNEIDVQLEKAGSSEAASSIVDQCLAEAGRHANEAENALRQMEMEARMLPPDQRTATEPKLRGYRSELVHRNKALGVAKTAAQRRSLLDEEARGETGSKSRRDRERLLGVDDALRRSSSQLDEAQRLALETEQIGTEVMSDLRSQRDTISRTRGNVSEIGEQVNNAKQLLLRMSRRENAKKVLLYCGVGSLLLMVVSAIYFGTMAEENKAMPGFQFVDNRLCSGTAYTVNLGIGCNGWKGVTEAQCQQYCTDSTPAPNCPNQPCFAAAFYPASGFCHLFTEPECQVMTAVSDIETYKKLPSTEPLIAN